MPNRTICSVLEEIRTCDKTKNYAYLLSLVEEAQTLANRMEAKLYDLSDYEYKMIEYKRIKKEIKELEQKKEDLNEAK